MARCGSEGLPCRPSAVQSRAALAGTGSAATTDAGVGNSFVNISSTVRLRRIASAWAVRRSAARLRAVACTRRALTVSASIGMPNPANTARIAVTTSASISVKPAQAADIVRARIRSASRRMTNVA